MGYGWVSLLCLICLVIGAVGGILVYRNNKAKCDAAEAKVEAVIDAVKK
jgi:hypothetical protein